MKTTIILLILFVNSCRALNETSLGEEWRRFQITFKKNYPSPSIGGKRSTIFKNNLQKILHHNRLYETGKVTYKLGINQFADWSAEEFSKYVNKFRMSKKDFDVKTYQVEAENLTVPDSIDWRLKWAVTDVRNQGHCGSCWSFSAAGALEGQAKIALKRRVRLSEQNLIDCADENYGNFGCDGGDTNAAFEYVRTNGIQAEDTYSYVASQGKCNQTSSELYVVNYLRVSPNEESLKKTVATIGPISVAMDSTAELQHYSAGVFLDRTCTNNLNHAVLVVGYGTDNGQDYWLVKNSWGSSWGEQGYFRLARNKYNNCGIASYASFPLVSDQIM